MYRQKQQRSKTLTMALVAVLVPLAAACGSEKADSGSGSVGADKPFTGVRWSIDSVTVDGTTHEAPDAARVRIDDSGEAAGSTGCNTFSARADVDGERVRISDAAFTEKACEQTPPDFEKSLGRVLADGSLTADTASDRLTLTTSAGDTVRLSRPDDASLYGTEWTVTTPGGKGSTHLTFDKKAGTVSGRLPCNHVNAKATVRDGHITLGAPVTTRMMCEGSLMDAEKRMLRFFEGRVDYRIDHGTLTLTSEDGTTVRAVAGK
ncbi:META domain-containing protein [Streptomyces sp. SID5910]|uniref:META domain-containing protein n=1 Tax=Streptomyces sp. SID5910 TaxID=2690312 RepID=UPI00136C0446|nr:META domain-containing protein [Streptomyces sp. SID5910]MYR43734.1 META domain-containing protein [Streptomyces sp. SID5910]